MTYKPDPTKEISEQTELTNALKKLLTASEDYTPSMVAYKLAQAEARRVIEKFDTETNQVNNNAQPTN